MYHLNILKYIYTIWCDVRLGEQSVITNIEQYKCYRQDLTWPI